MRKTRYVAGGFAVLAGAAGMSLIGGVGDAAAAPQVCAALPGQVAAAADCHAKSGPEGLGLAIVDGGGQASVTANNFSGPAAVALGPNASVHMNGVKPGLAIAIAGPNASVVVDGKTGPKCSGTGMAFAGDFQTLQGCWQ